VRLPNVCADRLQAACKVEQSPGSIGGQEDLVERLRYQGQSRLHPNGFRGLFEGTVWGRVHWYNNEAAFTKVALK
jgi:hypothetical protein